MCINNVTCLCCVCNFSVPKCLSPRQAKLVVNNISHTDHSITLQLPNPEQFPECENMSLASVEYTVYYGQIKHNRNMDCSTDMNSCSKMVCCNVTITKHIAQSSAMCFIRINSLLCTRNGHINLL